MSMLSLHKLGLAALVAAGLGACGNDAGGNDPLVLVAQTAAGAAAGALNSGDKAQPAAPKRTPEQMAAEALRVNPAPLILVNFENLGRSQVMAMTGDNQGQRTYMAPSNEALILRGGMLIGTRGFGNDLSVAEPQTEPLIRNARAGEAPRTMRYFSGDGMERPLNFQCSTVTGAQPGVVQERCSGHGISFENRFMPQGGLLPVSRQWAGPKLGYLTIQTLRP